MQQEVDGGDSLNLNAYGNTYLCWKIENLQILPFFLFESL